jgi:hypothetical protein
VCITGAAAIVRVPAVAGKFEGKGGLEAGVMRHASVMLRLGSRGCHQLNVARSGCVWYLGASVYTHAPAQVLQV